MGGFKQIARSKCTLLARHATARTMMDEHAASRGKGGGSCFDRGGRDRTRKGGANQVCSRALFSHTRVSQELYSDADEMREHKTLQNPQGRYH